MSKRYECSLCGKYYYDDEIHDCGWKNLEVTVPGIENALRTKMNKTPQGLIASWCSR